MGKYFIRRNRILKFSSIRSTILWLLSLGKYQLLLVYSGWPEGTVTSSGTMFQDEFLGEQNVALYFRVCGLIKNSWWKVPYKTFVPFTPILLLCTLFYSPFLHSPFSLSSSSYGPFCRNLSVNKTFPHPKVISSGSFQILT